MLRQHLFVDVAKSKKTILVSILIVGVALLTIGVLWIVDYIQTTQTGADYPTDTTLATSQVTSERRPNADTGLYTVPANKPRKIEIASLNVDAYVQRVGITSTGEMAAPNNIFFAGWYVNSPTPGDKGVSILNAHAGGRYEDGIFRRLGSLKISDTFRVQMGDLSWRSFEVVSADSYSLSDAGSALYSDDKTQTYDRRIIVVAKYVNI